MASARIVTAHTAELDAETLAAAQTLVEGVFGDGWTDSDWEHVLGGMHALAWDGTQLVGHAAVAQRRLLHRGRALRTGYVEGLAVHADHRRRGHAGALMDVVERTIRGAYELGALSVTDEAIPFYAGRDWQCWQGRTFALTPTGLERTEEDDDGVFVLRAGAELDLAGELACDWRDGEVW